MTSTPRLAALSFAVAVAVAVPFPGVADAGEGHGSGGEHGHDSGGENGHGSGHDRRHDDADTVPGAREITVRARSFAFSPREITIGAGEDVTIALRSTDVLHDFVVKSKGHVVSAKRKQTARGGLRIDQPGTYRFWCSIPGHRSAGMKGTVVVTSG